MHNGSRNSNHTYNMGGKPLQTVQEEKDHGVTISSDLKHTKHCKSASKKADAMLGFNARNLEYKTPRVMLTLYNSVVRPHLGYAVHAVLVSQPQERHRTTRKSAATRCEDDPITETQPYEERLWRLNIFTLKKKKKDDCEEI